MVPPGVMTHYAAQVPFAEAFRGPSGVSLLPGGFGRSTFALSPRTPMAVRGHGFRVWDERGAECIDLNNNFTALIHGHANAEVQAAASRALTDGASFGLPTAAEYALADHLVGRLENVDQIRFTNSGTEAVMLAIRIARAATGRDRVLMIRGAYHGTCDAALAATVGPSPRSRRGLPSQAVQDTVLVDVNDEAALFDAFTAGGDQLAAVVLDVMPNRVGLLALSSQFLALARELASAYGALLISDEVIALRNSYAGAMSESGIRPDLVAIGKIIGGGLPVGGVMGSAAVMAEINPLGPDGLDHGGTFSANPVTMAAGLAAMQQLTESEVARLNGLGERLRGHLALTCEEEGWEVRGRGSLVRPSPTGATPESTRDLQRMLWWEAYDRGVLLMQSGLASVSTPMDEGVVDDIADRLAAAIRAVGHSAE